MGAAHCGQICSSLSAGWPQKMQNFRPRRNGTFEAIGMDDTQPQRNAGLDQRRDELLRRALATPPISNEDILKRSKESRSK